MSKVRRDEFKHRCTVRMAAFGLSGSELGAFFDKAKSRVTEALRGDNTEAARKLRLQIDLKLTGMCNEERERVAAEINEVRGKYPELQGELSVILPEDMMYVVTEDGFPVGVWNPQNGTIRPLEPEIMRLTGRKAK